MNYLDKTYHVLGLFPQTQVYVGGISILRNTIALIKDIALIIIFRNSPKFINEYLDNFKNSTFKDANLGDRGVDIYIKNEVHDNKSPNMKVILESQDASHNLRLWGLGAWILSDVDPLKHVEGLIRGIITATPVVGSVYSLYQLGRYSVAADYCNS